MGRSIKKNMNPITESLINKAGGLLKVHPEINDWTGKSYQMFNTGSVEVDTAEFLYAMVRLTKPERILDTGTHYGVSALYMALAAEHNGFGEVVSMEIDEHYVKEAKKLWDKVGLSHRIKQYHGKSLEYKEPGGFQFMLLDTEPQIRFAELLKFEPVLGYGGYVFIHDLHRHMSQEYNAEHGFGFPFGRLPQEIVDMVNVKRLWPFHFPTPRGLLGLYRRHPDDYKWS